MSRYRKARIPKPLRRQVWEHCMGEKSSSGPCYVCRTKISVWDFECGHIKAESKGGKLTIQNLRPICGTCNKSMGTRNLEEYRKEFFADVPLMEKIKINLRNGVNNIF